MEIRLFNIEMRPIDETTTAMRLFQHLPGLQCSRPSGPGGHGAWLQRISTPIDGHSIQFMIPLVRPGVSF